VKVKHSTHYPPEFRCIEVYSINFFVYKQGSPGLAQMAHLSSSNPSLPSAVLAATRPQSLPGAEHLLSLNIAPDTRGSNTTPDHHCREDYLILAKDSNFFPILSIMKLISFFVQSTLI